MMEQKEVAITELQTSTERSTFGIINNNGKYEARCLDGNSGDSRIIYWHDDKNKVQATLQQITQQIPYVELTILKEQESCYVASGEKSDNSLDGESLSPKIAKTSKNYSSKKNYCVFCKKSNTKISRHLMTIHKDEPEVQAFMKYPKGNPVRSKLIEDLRKRGNYKHNTNSNTEPLAVVRRAHKKNRPKDHSIPCPECKGYYSKNSLRKHYAKCAKSSRAKGRRNVLVLSRRVSKQCHPKANHLMKKTILPVIREDDAGLIIKYDELAIIYGNRMAVKFRDSHHHDMIRNRLRLIGRFLLAIRSINSDVDDFQSVFHPKFCDASIEAINIVARLNEKKGKYECPATAASLGTLLKYCSNLLMVECIKQQDNVKKQNAAEYLNVLTSELNTGVNRTVTENQSEMARQKKVTLPKTSDIQMILDHLRNVTTKHYRKLKTSFDLHSWTELSKSVLVAILVFNRRRPGEMERCLISDYQSKQSLKDCDLEDLPDGASKNVEYSRFVIRGKKGKNVPVLLKKWDVRCIECILEFRTMADVPEGNPYVFASPGYSTSNTFRYLRACPLINKYAIDCGAQVPDSLKATTLRKHIATKSSTLDLPEGDIENLQQFMGHADKIHKKHYRQPIISRDIINMSKLLNIAAGHQERNCETSASCSRDIDHDELITSNAEEIPESNQNTHLSEGVLYHVPEAESVQEVEICTNEHIENIAASDDEILSPSYSPLGASNTAKKVAFPSDEDATSLHKALRTTESYSKKDFEGSTLEAHKKRIEHIENIAASDDEILSPSYSPLGASNTAKKVAFPSDEDATSLHKALRTTESYSKKDFEGSTLEAHKKRIEHIENIAASDDEILSPSYSPLGASNTAKKVAFPSDEDATSLHKALRTTESYSKKDFDGSTLDAHKRRKGNIASKTVTSDSSTSADEAPISKQLKARKGNTASKTVTSDSSSTSADEAPISKQLKARKGYIASKTVTSDSSTSADEASIHAPRERRNRLRWTTPQKNKVREIFKKHFKHHTYPSISECFQAIKENQILEGRTPRRIRSFVQNQFRIEARMKDIQAKKQKPKRKLHFDF